MTPHPLTVEMSPAGLPWLVDAVTGARVCPALVGGGDGPTNDDGDTDDDGGSDAGAGDTSTKAYTDAQLKSMQGRWAAKAKREAEQSLADSLGVTLEEAKAIIAAKRDADEQAKTQAQRDAEAAAQARAVAEQERAAAQQERLSVRKERELIRAGVADNVLSLALGAVVVEADASDEDIVVAVGKVKELMPQLFSGTPGTAPKPPATTGSNGSPPRQPPASPPATSVEQGKADADEWMKRHGNSRVVIDT